MHQRILVITSVLLLSLAGHVVSAEPLPETAPNWKITLVAKAPLIHAPTAVVETSDGTIYLGQDPMDLNGPPNVPFDFVITLRPRNGKLERTVFADKLWAVMGLELIEDTLFVTNAPYLTALRDTDGDGVADERVQLITGLGPEIPSFNGYNDHVASGIRAGMVPVDGEVISMTRSGGPWIFLAVMIPRFEARTTKTSGTTMSMSERITSVGA